MGPNCASAHFGATGHRHEQSQDQVALLFLTCFLWAQVALLFRAHRDLLEEFTYFLPDSSPPQQPQQVRPCVAARSTSRKLETHAARWLCRPSVVIHCQQKLTRVCSLALTHQGMHAPLARIALWCCK